MPKNSYRNWDQSWDTCQHTCKGVYLLIARLDRPAQIQIGALGIFDFSTGWYIYAGSAMGAGGLRARLTRHRRAEKRLHWHIDYLLTMSTLEATWHVASSEKLECAWAAAIARLPGAQIPVSGFGSSDCACPSHLIYHPRRPIDRQVRHALARITPQAADRLVKRSFSQVSIKPFAHHERR